MRPDGIRLPLVGADAETPQRGAQPLHPRPSVLLAFVLAGLLAASAWWRAGFDSLVMLLEFRRLGEVPELAALPLLMVAYAMYAQLKFSLPGTGSLQTARLVSVALLAPGSMLLLFAVAGAVLAPRLSPGYDQLLRAGLVPGLILGCIAILPALRGDGSIRSLPFARLSGRLPLLLLLVLLYTHWVPPVTVAALLLTWVTAEFVLIYPRAGIVGALRLAVRAMAAGMPAVVVLGLMLSWAAVTQGQGFGLFGQTLPAGLFWLVLTAMGLVGGWLLGDGYAGMGLLAAPAILLALASGVGLVPTAIVLTAAIALGSACQTWPAEDDKVSHSENLPES